MKKNKKGFTLVELLSVLVLIGLLAGLGIPGVMKISQNMKKKSFNTKINLIEQAGVYWGQDNKTLLQVYDDCIYENEDGEEITTSCNKIAISYLIESDYLDSEKIGEVVYTNPVDDSDMTDSCVYIYKKNNRVHATFSENDTDCVKSYLYNSVMNDTRITKNKVAPSFTGVATEEEGMYSAPDDYGNSWYFRGAQSNNYVNFAGFTWRIVRINGDGSVRLILDGTLDSVKREGLDTYAGALSSFQSTGRKGNAFVGYMFGNPGSSSYNDTHRNTYESTIKTAVDTFYETYIESDTNNYHYEKYLADTLFCGDKRLASPNVGNKSNEFGYGNESTYASFYSASGRLFHDNGLTRVITAKPTLECAKDADNNYSRYTSKLNMNTSTNKGISVNNDLKHPIALLSADELVMAGAWRETNNTSYYLYNSSNNVVWWTMTPFSFGGTNTYVFTGNGKNGSNYYSLYRNAVNGSNSIRPVINLRHDVKVKVGDGTKNNPYVLEEMN